jgi:7-carboxy-7-deazaguanine synthase
LGFANAVQLSSSGMSNLGVNGVEQVDRFMRTFQPQISRKRERHREALRKTLAPDEVTRVSVGEIAEVVNLTTTAGNFFVDGYLVDQCDSKYSWDWSNYDPRVELIEQSVDDVLAKLEGMGITMVVITGGEPLLQQRALQPLLQQIKARNWRVEIETAGTLPWQLEPGLVDQFNVSPKLENSGNPLERRYKPNVLRHFERSGRAVFKFVATDTTDLDEVAHMVDDCGLTNVWIMPEGTDAATLADRQRALAPAVLERGWNLTTRLHILLWGDKRGV